MEQRSNRYLSGGQSDDQIGNEGVLGLSAPMAHHHSPTVGARQLRSKFNKKISIQRKVESKFQSLSHKMNSAACLGHWSGRQGYWNGSERTYAWMDSVTEPIWLTFSKRQLHDFSSIAFWIRFGFVTVKSSLKLSWLQEILHWDDPLQNTEKGRSCIKLAIRFKMSQIKWIHTRLAEWRWRPGTWPNLANRPDRTHPQSTPLGTRRWMTGTSQLAGLQLSKNTHTSFSNYPKIR